eukprot:1632777-Rhodomonas_salina.1
MRSSHPSGTVGVGSQTSLSCSASWHHRLLNDVFPQHAATVFELESSCDVPVIVGLGCDMKGLHAPRRKTEGYHGQA